MIDPDLGWLVLAGVASGLASSLAGLASVVSYPALLALGLPPIAANVSNTTAMTGVLLGSAVGARRELRGHRHLLARLAAASGLGGVLGAALLLVTPAETFTRIVPFFVAFGSLLLLGRDALRKRLARAPASLQQPRTPVALMPAVFATGIYAGYFGAGAGIIMLAVLAAGLPLAFTVTNAIKTIVTGAGNLVATCVYIALAPVHWPAVVALGLGLLGGGWLGPHIGRTLPERPLRIAVGVAGLGLAAWLWLVH
jgi:uncharacterized membrane protein YfcA